MTCDACKTLEARVEALERRVALLTAQPAPARQRGISAHFMAFWDAYPKYRRRGRAAALKIWERKKLDSKVGEVMSALASWKASEHWRKGGGEYIPMPTTWLNREDWLDPPSPKTAKEQSDPLSGRSDAEMSELLRRVRESDPKTDHRIGYDHTQAAMRRIARAS